MSKKYTYYIVWIEGIGSRRGDKVKALTDYGLSYTTKLTESLRVKNTDIPYMKDYLKRHGISEWVYNNPNTFVETTYVPKGTLLRL